jgi:hypothetical protein
VASTLRLSATFWQKRITNSQCNTKKDGAKADTIFCKAYWSKKNLELYPDSVFRFGIGWYFLCIFHNDTEGKLGKAFGILHLAGTPFFPQREASAPFWMDQAPRGKNKFPPILQNGVPAKFHKIVCSNTDRIYRPASASNLPIPAKLPVYRWSTTLKTSQPQGTFLRQQRKVCSAHAQRVFMFFSTGQLIRNTWAVPNDRQTNT